MTLNIEDKSYTIPNRLTIEQWSQIVLWDFESHYNWPRLLSIITGAPTDKLVRAPREGLELGISIISEIANVRKEAPMVDVSKLMFGQFVDLEICLSAGVNTKVQEMLNILAPEVEYIDEALWVIESYISWRNTLYKQYSNLFGLNDEEEDEDPDAEGPIDPNHIARSWYKVMVRLSNDNILNLDAVTEQGVVKTLNFMALQKQEIEQANQKILNQNRKNDLQRNRR